jgi:crotonobetainyl-CoA:carnitine CoA-transferase CaiB-like acyl-CoA transferase
MDVIETGGFYSMTQPMSEWAKEQDDPKVAHTKLEALDDITVLDLSCNSFAGSYCTSMLSEMGAEVIKVEPPDGDFLRKCTPYGITHKGEGLNSLSEGRNKFHVTLNLEKPEAREMLKSLVSQADVLVETFLPGVMDGWGLGYEQLKEINPRLIFASITPYGQFGPKSGSRMPDYDSIIQARSAIQYATGEILPEGKTFDEMPWATHTKQGTWIGGASAGTFMAAGILAAVYWRHTSGEGQALDCATSEAYASFDDFAYQWYQDTGTVCERFGNLDVAGWLYCFAPTKDGSVFLGALRLEMWQAFADMLGKWDEWGASDWRVMADFTSEEAQLKWADLVYTETRKYTSRELVELSVNYSKSGRLAPIAPVVATIGTPMDTLSDPNWNERGIFTPVDDPVYGPVVIAQSQYKLTETPPRTKWASRPVGYDNGFIYLKYLSYGKDKLKKLEEEGIV